MRKSRNINNRGLAVPLPDRAGLFEFSDNQNEIIDHLVKLDKSSGIELANIYKGVVVGLANKANPERFSQVAHSIRELTSILPFFYPGMPLSMKNDKVSRLYEIINPKSWEKVYDWFKNDSIEKPNSRIINFFEHVNEVVNAGGQITKMGKLVELSKPDIPEYWTASVLKEWKILNDWFMKHVHHPDLKKRKQASVIEGEFEKQVAKFENILRYILIKKPFFEHIAEIDSLLIAENPTEDNFKELSRLISHPRQNIYFFEKCDNPNWIIFLEKNHAFNNPPELIKEKDYVRFTDWEESRYLARVADREPEKVLKIINSIDTKNQILLCNFVDAALNSPSKVASKYVEQIIKQGWMRNVYIFRLPEKLSDLMEKLAKDGYFKEALIIAKEVFDVKIDKPVKISEDENSPLSYIHPDAKPLFSDWEYGEIADKKLEKLIKSKPLELFYIFAEKLNKALELEKQGKNHKDFSDYSYIWRPAINHPEHKHEHVKDILIDELIKIIEAYKDDKTVIGEIVFVLGKYKFTIFKRLKLFLYSICSNFENESKEIIMNAEIIYDYDLRREYLPLLEKYFSKLSRKSRKEILDLIDRGLEISNKISKKRREAVVLRWKALYLKPIKESLPKKYREFYNQFQLKYGEPVDDEGRMQSWSGYSSPITVEELEKLSIQEVAEYLANFKEGGNFNRGPSTYGLGMALQDAISNNPNKYLELAEYLWNKKIRAVYVYHYLYGFDKAYKAGKKFSWTPVIGLCNKIIDEGDSLDSIKPQSDGEQTWDSVRYTIIDIIRTAITNFNFGPSFELRGEVWKIIENFSSMPDSEILAKEREIEEEETFDPMTSSINSKRGLAVHAVINYGLWVAKYNENKDEVKMPPEVEKVLDSHLDPSEEKSLSIRSIYGWRLPNLLHLNKKWVEKKINKIFPSDEKLKHFFIPAWQGYLTNNVYNEIFDLLKNKYKGSFSLLGKIKKTKTYSIDIDERLAQHMAIAMVNYPQHQDIVADFIKISPPKERGELVNFIGRRVLRDDFKNLKDPRWVKGKLIDFWKTRLKKGKIVDKEEFKEFGWWFIYTRFGRKETIINLLKTLKITNGDIEMEHEVAKKIVDYAKDFPLEAITCLEYIAKAQKESYRISMEREIFREIIIIVKKSKNNKAIKKADQLLDYLGSIGFIEEFRDLWKK